jgi:AcrR family transcriptional regulator
MATVDRRSARTRSVLQQALLSLILKKDYEAITINEICDTANVGRSTFYAHFTGKDDLQRSGLENLRGLLAPRRMDGPMHSGAVHERILGFSLPMLKHARDHLNTYRALHGSRGGTLALDTIRRILADQVRTELAAPGIWPSAARMPHEVIVEYIVGAYMAVLTRWLDGGAKLPPEDVDAMFVRLAVEGIAPSGVRGHDP